MPLNVTSHQYLSDTWIETEKHVQFRGHILYINTKQFYSFQDGNFYSNHSFPTTKIMFEHILQQNNLGWRLMIDFIIISSHLQLYGLRRERSAELLTDHHIGIHTVVGPVAVQDVNWLGIDKYIKEHLAKSLIQDIFNIHPKKKQNFNITLRDVLGLF